MDIRYSIEVRNVYKKYLFNPENTLNGISLKIPPGSMYGLLGPSGCGKTTLLKCIIGTTKIDSGMIHISASTAQHIGFMPQELSLYEDFTIKEIYKYYGTLHDMDPKALKSRTDMLTNLLDIPHVTRVVKQCSGGEKRRISLAITLIHDPTILILDEPTVGLDPVLSFNISKYLRSLAVDEKKTIIITTHYMEEARSLDFVGFMRGGRLLCEDSPQSLMAENSCDTLDQVFLNLIHKSERVAEECEVGSREEASHSYLTCTEKQPLLTWKHMKAQVYKNYRHVYRNIGEPVSYIILPGLLIFLLLYGMVVYHGPKKFGVYNEETDVYSCSNPNAVIVEECLHSSLYSCRYLELIKKNLSLVDVNSKEEGLELVKTGQLYGFLNFPANFSTSINKRLSFRISDSDDTYEENQLQVFMDHSRYFVAKEVLITIYDTLLKLVENICLECGIDQRLAKGLGISEPNTYGRSSLRTYLIPGFIHAMFIFFIYMGTAVALGHQKSRGTLTRDKINGMTTIEIICGTVIKQVVVMHLQTLATLYVNHGIFSEPNVGSYGLLYFLLLLNQIFGMLLGILVTLFVYKPYPVMFLGIAVNMSTIFMGGGLWAVEGIYWLLKIFVTKIPFVMLVITHHLVMGHGLPITHPNVYLPVVFSVLTNLLLVFLIFIKLKINNYQF